MGRLVRYSYYSYTLGCGCCSDSESTYDLYEDGKLAEEDIYCGLCENEQELREELAHLLPFDVDPDSNWF